MTTLVGFVFAMGILVFVHEYGHYYVAKLFGIRIEEFSIGFGKVLFTKTDANGVKWNLRAIPLGGFVKMFGDINAASTEQQIDDKDLSYAFVTKPWYIRFSVIAAGPIANYMFAIMIFASMYFVFGKVEIDPIIDEVVHNSPAEKAGLLAGDEFLTVDGNIVSSFFDLQKVIMLNTNAQIELEIKRDNKTIRLLVTPENKQLSPENKVKVNYIGISSSKNHHHKEMSLFDSISQGSTDVVESSYYTLKAIGQMLTGQRSTDEISGPLKIAQESGKSLANSITDFIFFVAILSINLGLVNLLPIPILDGGHLAVILCEFIIQRPFTQFARSILLRVGITIITFLIVISVSNDIKSLIY